MRVRRHLGSLLIAALATTTLSVVGTAGAASAATVAPTRVVMKLSQNTAEANDKISVTGEVQGQASDGSWGTLPYGTGSATLQFLPKGSSTWRTIETDDQGYSFYFYSVRVTGPGTFRVAYGGGTYDSNYDGTPEYQFTASSSDKTPRVTRKLSYKEVPGRKTGIQGKIAPKAKVKIVVLKKVGKKYKHFRTLHSARNGAFKVVLPAPRRGKWFWRINFMGSKGFATSVVSGHTYSY
ncbi:hypothetical protein GCM10009795_062600 [Nocardioides hankookensis]|uniref:Bacterial Ig domain-containing protein n=1 Tax=Nocardioides hankookensis TaxID=443157 RepID=A0ABW1LP23_9ACTN